MDNNDWELLEETFGMPQAELIRSYLEAQGIPVFLSQEGAGHALGLTVGTMGRVEVLVPAHQLEAARQALAALNSDSVSTPAEDEPSSTEEPLDTAD